ncbi:IDEAL domain-containing protein [Bacillus cereus]|uniref:IDEAL domain-containing protein n=1 Tax=Bacillus cereus TaxID=1396 RepID=UPI001C8CCEC0|nr:IDEAL domain-containing protein [Bacillus cereus]MBX9158541.1 IDEAL domain-containing protein [Bacillus cereus]
MRTIDKNREFVEWLLAVGKFKTKHVIGILVHAKKFNHTLENIQFLSDEEYKALTGKRRVLVVKMNRYFEEIDGATELRILDVDGTYDTRNLDDALNGLRIGSGSPFYMYIQMEGIVGADNYTSVTEKVSEFDIEVRTGSKSDELPIHEFRDIARAVADEVTYRKEIDKALDDRDEPRFHRLVVAYKKKHGML